MAKNSRSQDLSAHSRCLRILTFSVSVSGTGFNPPPTLMLRSQKVICSKPTLATRSTTITRRQWSTTVRRRGWGWLRDQKKSWRNRFYTLQTTTPWENRRGKGKRITSSTNLRKMSVTDDVDVSPNINNNFFHSLRYNWSKSQANLNKNNNNK